MEKYSNKRFILLVIWTTPTKYNRANLHLLALLCWFTTMLSEFSIIYWFFFCHIYSPYDILVTYSSIRLWSQYFLFFSVIFSLNEPWYIFTILRSFFLKKNSLVLGNGLSLFYRYFQRNDQVYLHFITHKNSIQSQCRANVGPLIAMVDLDRKDSMPVDCVWSKFHHKWMILKMDDLSPK